MAKAKEAKNTKRELLKAPRNLVSYAARLTCEKWLPRGRFEYHAKQVQHHVFTPGVRQAPSTLGTLWAISVG